MSTLLRKEAEDSKQACFGFSRTKKKLVWGSGEPALNTLSSREPRFNNNGISIERTRVEDPYVSSRLPSSKANSFDGIDLAAVNP